MFFFRDEIRNETLPTTIPPRFVPKTNKPIPLALRRFLDQDDEDDDVDMESNYSHNDDDKQTSKTKYTNYSMTSSVIRRNQDLQNIDQHFDKVFDEYDDEQIGSLDNCHINQQGASIEDDLVKQTIQQLQQQQMQTYDFILVHRNNKILIGFFIETRRRIIQKLSSSVCKTFVRTSLDMN